MSIIINRKYSKDIVKINEHLLVLWNKNPKLALKMSLTVFSDRKIVKNKFFYIKNGLILSEMSEHKLAHRFFDKATKLYPNDELCSLSKYLELVDLHKYKFAIKELDRFLSQHPAKSYKVTLKELVGDLKKGVATDYKDVILKYCKLNQVKY